MSKISNKIIEAKLRQILVDETGADPPAKFDDNTALTFIFNYFEDQISFNQILLEKNLDEIQELKVLEMALRAEIDFYKEREKKAMLNQKWDAESDKNTIIEESRRNADQWKRLQLLCLEKEKLLRQSDKNRENLEKKIFQISNSLNESQKNVQQLQLQLESERQKDKQNKSQIKQLITQRDVLFKQHQEEVEKYRTVFIDELTRKLNKQKSQELQDLFNLNKKLQQEIKSQESLFKDAVAKVSEIFKVSEPSNFKEDLNIWVQTINQKFEHLRTQIKKTIKEDIKLSEDPIKMLAEHKKKQILSREFMITRYMNA